MTAPSHNLSSRLDPLFARVLGRLPIGWLQLRRNPMRFLTALAGVAFATVLVLMQLGFPGALLGSIRLPYDRFAGQVLISASDMNTLKDASPLPRQRLYEALGVEGVAGAAPLLTGTIDWKQADGTIRTLDVFGIDPVRPALRDADIDRNLERLAVGDAALLDRRTRNVDPAVLEALATGREHRFEVRGRRHTLSIVGALAIGGGFSADGHLILSDQSFLRLFPGRSSAAPNHIVINLAPGADPEAVLVRLRAAIPWPDTVVRTVSAAVAADQAFQSTQRPIGVVFGFGMVIGVLVGIVIVHQILSADVADHMREYATFKAIGHRHALLIGIVLEQAVILGVLGFLPGLGISLLLYEAVALGTGLPMDMTVPRALIVFLGTILLCTLAGAFAARRLRRADPADLF
ncbi:MAG: hypothetical protein RLY86_1890 [Pseudomonadota bacterium]|jgi:putative ABC transport system permease protein